MLKLAVHFTDDYPDTPPQLSLTAVEGNFDDNELQSLLDDLQQSVIKLWLPSFCDPQDLTHLTFVEYRQKQTLGWP